METLVSSLVVTDLAVATGASFMGAMFTLTAAAGEYRTPSKTRKVKVSLPL